MPILYSVIARSNTVLAKYAECVGNFGQVTEQIFQVIELRNHKLTYSHGSYHIHYACEDNIVYMCITDNDFDKAKAFLFLAEIKRLFIAEYGLTVATSIAYGMNTEFSPVLALEMRRFSESDDMSTINAMHGQMGELKNIMVMNIDTMTQRGEKIDLLVNKAENLRNSSVSFRQTSTSLARAMFWRNIKMYVIITCILIFIIYVIVSMACGGLAWQSCVKKK